MSREKRIDAYLQESLNLLEDDRFEVFEDERFDDIRFRAVAVKNQRVGISSQELVFVFARFTKLTLAEMEDFVDDAYAYAKETRQASLPVGMNNLLWVYPVALAEEATDKVVDAIREENPRIQGFGYAAFPVIYDASADEVYFYEGNAGLLASRGMNKVGAVVKKYLSLG